MTPFYAFRGLTDMGPPGNNDNDNNNNILKTG